MSLIPLTAGFIPLTDAAPLIVARELGFAEQEGLALDLHRAPSWSMLRDELAFGALDAAHLLSPMPVAMTLGLGGVHMPVDAVQVMSVGGEVIGVSRPLAERLRDQGHDFAFDDPRAAGSALLSATGGRLRIGVPFPFSMHAELVYYWLGAIDAQRGAELDIHTVPPPQMADALGEGEIDAFCVGEPWGSIGVETKVAELLLPGSAIWSYAPDKVLAMRHEHLERDPDLAGRLMRALWRAGNWLGSAENLIAAAEILAQPEHLDIASEVIERSLGGRLVIAPSGETRIVTQFQDFSGPATFPWRSQGEWIGARLATRHKLDSVAARATGWAVFRSDLYRRFLGPVGAPMPGASAKVEGALPEALTIQTGNRVLSLPRNRFFDGQIFDPDVS